jgi:hypothetical protein
MVLCLAAADDGAAGGSAPQHDHSRHHTGTVESRGDQAMGFAQARTRHTFVTRRDGGTIRVVADDATDAAGIAQIRTHLREIAQAFAAGDFSKPEFIHDKDPPGAEVMRRLKDRIRYEYVEIPAGAEVSLRSRDPRAVRAIHDFLAMQIREHQTGDPMPAGHAH